MQFTVKYFLPKVDMKIVGLYIHYSIEVKLKMCRELNNSKQT